ncbi:MAG TPA: GTP cyclohydrolase I FolE [Niabella sp.]|nr:GTP cyclohydrolase I FolE [Niabella sp.]HQW14237.1 GTP cyclohydrolase I FolE [Niabella sp.]HQX19637.1 GTP cyclohydrolase I FolE [Niabella sp.]HQX39929.1 GTP cyclohydrolase I FolE [Niabella sp.]HRB06922.1 GTP cyclohydrolase I FolE [Niabella sp.]
MTLIKSLVNTEYKHHDQTASSMDVGPILSDTDKIKIISGHFAEILETLGLDLSDDSLKDSPDRVAKMFVNELFSGLDPGNKPTLSLFDNKYEYHKVLLEKDISLFSTCEHHFLPIIGKVHVAYIPAKKVIGLSKIHRLVQYYAHRPQVQERLTMQIADGLKEALDHEDVAVMIEADHLCVAARGIRDVSSKTITYNFSGQFENIDIQHKFLSQLKGGQYL